jgi:hypothetical protein
MDELYRAKLVADPTPHSQPQPNLNPGFMAPPTRHEPEPIGLNNLYYHPPAERSAPINEPTVKSKKVSRGTKLHPLIWFSLILSLLALVLSVPKGSLPTLTGRHKALRVSAQPSPLTERQEKKQLSSNNYFSIILRPSFPSLSRLSLRVPEPLTFHQPSCTLSNRPVISGM